MTCPVFSGSDRETALELIVRQAEPGRIFDALCLEAGERPEDRQIAFFTLDDDVWRLAATGELQGPSRGALDRVRPEELSKLILSEDATGRNGAAFEDGWAQHLYSGIGEILGMLVCFAPGPVALEARRAEALDGVCRLASLAIEQRNLRDELTWRGDHDSVTGLCTHVFFARALSARMRRSQGPVALLHVNLDRFRQVNDVLGHSVGNSVLWIVGKRFAARLSAGGNEGDLLSRAGGDEFAVMLDHGTRERTSAMAESLLRSLAMPLSVAKHQMFVSASIGISCAGPESTAQSLQREAYVALYHAKKSGKSRFLHFDPSMAATSPERLEMEKRLRSALAAGELQLNYQPQVELATGRPTGAEALLRWNPPGLGVISPATFVPILEETGLIVEFGRRALREACRQGRKWLDESGVALQIAVNVSALQLRDAGFVADVEKALAESGLPAELLELELTESVFIGDYGSARRLLERLHRTGLTLALDDFGTGQSSLSYLQELPFHRLKIDRSFVGTITGPGTCPPLIANIIGMARSLGMASVAEGIERVDQAEVLRATGCAEGQGYLFSPPLPPEEFADWIAKARTTSTTGRGLTPGSVEVSQLRNDMRHEHA